MVALVLIRRNFGDRGPRQVIPFQLYTSYLKKLMRGHSKFRACLFKFLVDCCPYSVKEFGESQPESVADSNPALTTSYKKISCLIM